VKELTSFLQEILVAFKMPHTRIIDITCISF